VFIDLLYEHSWILMSYIYWYGLTEYRNKIKQDVSLYFLVLCLLAGLAPVGLIKASMSVPLAR
jgi:hypothetical protein